MNVLQACSKKKINITDNYAIGISLQNNVFDIPVSCFFSMAMRKNKKRQFLFVSKLIGKHIHIRPQVLSVTGALLAETYMRETVGECHYNADLLADSLSDAALLGSAMREIESSSIVIEKPTLFIGFAETATGLAHAVFRSFRGNCSFAHTTRVPLEDREPELRFAEEHSHASSHLCYFDKDTHIESAERIVLIDDEITTGKTTLNFIEALLKLSPAREFTVLSILDWRDDDKRQSYFDFEKRNGVKIKCISLLSGLITVPPYTEIENTDPDEGADAPENKITVKSICLDAGKKYYYRSGCEKRAFSAMTGRFGISSRDNRANLEIIDKASEKCRKMRRYKQTLCLGTGEFIYIPSLIACGMGEGCLFGSTTLSPIITSDRKGYPVKSDITYTGEAGCSDAGSLYHIYNVIPGRCPEVFIISEQDLKQSAKDEIEAKLQNYGVKNLVFVSLV